MASRLSVFVALFVCFLVLADASLHTIEEEENRPSYRQCQQQLQRQRFQSCQRYISSQQQRGSGRWEDDLEMNPQRRGQQSVQQCCQEIQQVDRECRCEALKEVERMAQQQQQQGGRWSGSSYGGQLQRIKQQVRRIPQMCSIQVPQQCQQGY